MQFSAWILSSKLPILINVSVLPTALSPMTGIVMASPKTPVPLALGRNILKLSKL